MDTPEMELQAAPAEAAKKPWKGITAATLKIIAITTMLIDHIGASFFESLLIYSQYGASVKALLERKAPFLYASWMDNWQKFYSINMTFREIGRIAFPIFCFQIVEGALHTHHKAKYAIRLFLFGLISEIPFDRAFFGQTFDWSHQNVYFTLFLGLLAVFCLQLIPEKPAAPPHDWSKPASEQPAVPKVRKTPEEVKRTVLGIAGAVACAVVAAFLKTDYDWKGVASIIVLYLFHKDRVKQCIAGAIAFLWEFTAPLAFIPVRFYNGKYGIRSKAFQYFFYLFYPGHLLLLGLFRMYLGI